MALTDVAGLMLGVEERTFGSSNIVETSVTI
jgi:hypothetical protein